MDKKRNIQDEKIECTNNEACILYKQTFDITRQLIVILDNNLTINYVNKAIIDYLDMTEDQIIGREYWNLPIWSHSSELQNKIIFAMENIYHGKSVKFETTHRDKNGSIRDIDFEVKTILDDRNQIKHLIAMGYDVTEIKETKSALKRREEDLKTFFKYSVEGYLIHTLQESIFLDPNHLEDAFNYIVENEKVSDYNEALLRILKIGSEDINPSLLIDFLFEDTNEYFLVWKRTIFCGSSDKEVKVVIDNQIRTLDINLIASIDDSGKYSGVFIIIRDITERILLIDKMTYLATKDSLTNINNRRHYFEQSREIRSKYPNRDVYIVMMDIDNFKNVNDTYGHDVGDIVIRKLADLLVTKLNEDSIVGRVGGEEFAISIYKKNCDIKSGLENLRKSIEDLVVISDEFKIKFTVSIGFSKMLEGASLEDTLKKSDKALYKAKKMGKNRVEEE